MICDVFTNFRWADPHPIFSYRIRYYSKQLRELFLWHFFPKILNRPLSLVHRTDAICERGLKAAQEQDAEPTRGGRLPTRQQLAPEGALGEISPMKPSKEESFESSFSGGAILKTTKTI